MGIRYRDEAKPITEVWDNEGNTSRGGKEQVRVESVDVDGVVG